MGLLRLSLIGDVKFPTTTYVVLIERQRDHLFLDFTDSKAPTKAAPVLTLAGAPVFSAQPKQPSTPMLRKSDFTQVGGLLDSAWWLDIDVTKFEDSDYCIWYVDPVTKQVRDGVIMPLIAGDDMSLTVRLRTKAMNFNWSLVGLPGTTGAIKGSGGIGLALPSA